LANWPLAKDIEESLTWRTEDVEENNVEENNVDVVYCFASFCFQPFEKNM